jgi:hemoglobin
MKTDILNRSHVELLVNRFYEKVKKHPALGSVFNEIMKVDWEKHLPKMYSFWENIIFQTGAYKGFPFAAHMPVNEKAKLTPELFNAWLTLFHETIDELFTGNEAETLKLKSQNIKEVWSYKMDHINNQAN